MDFKEIERRRFEFDLDENSNVIEIGGYLGWWSQRMFCKYKCNMTIFEPIPEFYNRLEYMFSNNDKVNVVNVALGGNDREVEIFVDKDSTTMYKRISEDSLFIKVEDVNNHIISADLLEINCEGSEYEILQRLIRTHKIENFDRLLIQFHKFVDMAVDKKKQIESKLQDTHTRIWNAEWNWCYWEKK